MASFTMTFSVQMRYLDFSERAMEHMDGIVITDQTDALLRLAKHNGVTFTGQAWEFRGEGLVYDGGTYPVGGTITSVERVYNDSVLFSFTDIAVEARHAAGDTQKFVRKALNGDDTIIGSRSNDDLLGWDGDDFVSGKGGDDIIFDYKGDDILHGGLGADRLSGWTGADTYLYKSIKDSTVRGRDRDLIVNFQDDDTIDLKKIDARETKNKNNPFIFSGEDHFSGAEGELRYKHNKNGETLIYGDVDGDKKADFSIKLSNAVDLTADDFLL